MTTSRVTQRHRAASPPEVIPRRTNDSAPGVLAVVRAMHGAHISHAGAQLIGRV